MLLNISFKTTIKNVPNTEDAVLVSKWFANDLEKKLFQFLFKDKIDSLITEAKRLEKESKEK